MSGHITIIRDSDISDIDHRLSSIPEDKGNILVHIEDVDTLTFSISHGQDGIGFIPVDFFSLGARDLSDSQKQRNKNQFISKIKNHRKNNNIWVVDIAYKNLVEIGVNLRNETLNWKERLVQDAKDAPGEFLRIIDKSISGALRK